MRPHKLAFERVRTLWVAKFYYKYLRRYSWIQRLLQESWRIGLPYLLPLLIPSAYKRQLLPAREAVRELSLKTITLTLAETVETPAPTFYPEDMQARIHSPHTSYEFPAITAIIFSNATVQGGSNFIFLGPDIVVHHDLYDFAQDFTAEEMHGRATIYPRKKMIRWYDTPVALPPLPRAATLLDSCAANYAHWMTEVLPRAAMLAAQPEYDGIPVLVDAGLHANLYESLKLVVGDRPIHKIARHESISVEELIVISPTGYAQFDKRDRKQKPRIHGVFSGHALNILHTTLVQACEEQSVAKQKKIFLKRNSIYRSITNNSEVEELMMAQGFVAIASETLSFSEQVALFSHAEVIVGQGGASFANVIFCKPKTHINILVTDYPGTGYWYWQNIALTTNNKITFILGGASNHRDGPHGDFVVPLDTLRAALN